MFVINTAKVQFGFAKKLIILLKNVLFFELKTSRTVQKDEEAPSPAGPRRQVAEVHNNHFCVF